MNTIKMITAMCAMGTTENMGICATPYKNDVADFLQDFFCGVGEKVEIVGDIEEDTYYLYIYDETLCNYVADAIVQVYNDEYNVIAEIYLYKIED